MTCSSLLCAAVVLLGNILLLTPAGSPLRVAGGLIVLLLPGLAWARWLLSTTPSLVRWTAGAGLSYALAMTAGLALSYFPGPISFWVELAVLDGLALIPLLGIRGRPPRARPLGLRRAGRGQLAPPHARPLGLRRAGRGGRLAPPRGPGGRGAKGPGGIRDR